MPKNIRYIVFIVIAFTWFSGVAVGYYIGHEDGYDQGATHEDYGYQMGYDDGFEKSQKQEKK